MGNHKQKWTTEEEAALKAGVDKHGTGKWKTILIDPDFAPALTQRSNIDLKDKWRNLGISGTVPVSASATKDKSPVLTITNGTLPTTQNTNTALTIVDANGITETPKTPANVSPIPTKRYYSMIFEAISSINDSRGPDFNAIASFIQQKHEVPQNFRRVLTSMLRRLTVQRKLEKVEQRFKIRNLGSRIPTPRVRDAKPGTSKNSDIFNPATVEGAISIACYRVVDADHKSFVAAEAVKESEDIADMAEESENMLEVVKGIWERFNL